MQFPNQFVSTPKNEDAFMKDQATFIDSLSNEIIRPAKISQHSFRYLNSNILFIAAIK